MTWFGEFLMCEAFEATLHKFAQALVGQCGFSSGAVARCRGPGLLIFGRSRWLRLLLKCFPGSGFRLGRSFSSRPQRGGKWHGFSLLVFVQEVFVARSVSGPLFCRILCELFADCISQQEFDWGNTWALTWDWRGAGAGACKRLALLRTMWQWVVWFLLHGI